MEGRHEIYPPIAGLDRSAGVEKQRPFSYRNGKNWLPIDPFDESLRGGPRWGLDRSFRYNQVNGSNPVRLLADVDIADPNYQTHWEDPFVSDSLGGLWTQLTITGGASLTAVTGTPSIARGLAYVEGTGASTAVHKACWLTSPSPWSIGSDSDDTYEYRVELFVVPHRGTTASTTKVEVFLRLDDASPDYGVEGIRVALGFTDAVGGYGGNVTVRQGSAQTAQQAFATGNTQDTASNNVAMPGWFSVRLRRHGTSGGFIDVYWRGIELLANYNIPGSWSATGDRVVGFGLEAAGSANRISIDTFRLSYRTNTPINRAILVASSGSTTSDGNVAREEKLNDYSEIPTVGANQLNGTVSLQAAQRGQVLYIADHGPVKASGEWTGSRDVRVWSDLTDTYLDDPSATFTSAGIDTSHDMVYVVSANPNDENNFVEVYTHTIAAVVSNTRLRLSHNPGSGGGSPGDPANYRVERGPKEYDVYNASVKMWGQRNSGLVSFSNVGPIPLGGRIIVPWDDRLVISGIPSEPGAIYASRSGDPHDWDTSADPADELRAWGSPSNPAFSAVPSQPITALMPFTNDYMLAGQRDKLIQFRGSPTRGGTIDLLSGSIGIIDKFSCCLLPDGNGAIWGHDGIFMVAGDGGSKPVALSPNKLPQELREINPANTVALMAYEHRMRSILMFASPHGKHFAYHVPTQSFHPIELPANFEPYAIVNHQSQSASDRGVYLGCKDGYIRRFHPQHHREDTHNMNSEVLYGVLTLGRGVDFQGAIKELSARLAEQSASVRWSIHVGQTAEQALSRATAGTAAIVGTFSDTTRPDVHHPMAGDRYAFVKIRDNGGIVYRPWAIESLMIDVEAAGLQRV